MNLRAYPLLISERRMFIQVNSQRSSYSGFVKYTGFEIEKSMV